MSSSLACLNVEISRDFVANLNRLELALTHVCKSRQTGSPSQDDQPVVIHQRDGGMRRNGFLRVEPVTADTAIPAISWCRLPGKEAWHDARDENNGR